MYSRLSIYCEEAGCLSGEGKLESPQTRQENPKTVLTCLQEVVIFAAYMDKKTNLYRNWLQGWCAAGMIGIAVFGAGVGLLGHPARATESDADPETAVEACEDAEAFSAEMVQGWSVQDGHAVSHAASGVRH